MPNNMERIVIGKIDDLAANPRARNTNVTALKGGGFRLRVGDWRVLYHLDDKAKLLKVAAIRPRGRAYR